MLSLAQERRLSAFTIAVMVALLLGALPFSALAQSKGKAPSAGDSDLSLGYPELQVEPKASKRLERESSMDLGSKWAAHRAIQASAATLMIASAVQMATLETKPTQTRYSGVTGLAVGAAWWGLTSYLSLSYHPFTSNLEAISRLPVSTPAERLVKERYAEEALREAARAGRRLKWFSFLTQAGTSAYLLSEATKGTAGQTAAAVSLAASVAPLIFSHPWIAPSDLQEGYKKKVYGPISSVDWQAGWLRPVANGPAVPSLLATLRF